MFVGCYGGLRIVAHYELAIDHPSEVDRRWFDPTLSRTAYAHATTAWSIGSHLDFGETAD
jgi:hypothetical protein